MPLNQVSADKAVATKSSAVMELLSRHERSTKDLLEQVSSRLQTLEAARKEVSELSRALRAKGDDSRDVDLMMHKLSNDIMANLRMTASIRVALQRCPNLGHYHLIVE